VEEEIKKKYSSVSILLVLFFFFGGLVVVVVGSLALVTKSPSLLYLRAHVVLRVINSFRFLEVVINITSVLGNGLRILPVYTIVSVRSLFACLLL